MRINLTPWILSAFLSVGIFLLAGSEAHAELDACGGIFLEADSRCEYRPKEQCTTQCQTVAVEQSCVAKVYDACESSCTETQTTECTETCSSSCVSSCTTTTTSQQGPSCMDLCLADCQGDDDEACASSRYRNACGRCTAHNCEKRCEARCGDAEAQTQVTTTTECMPTCSSACSASCTAKANTTCQVACQEKTYTECEQKMVEQCETTCEQEGGAIFCDGQFVNASNAKSCADQLRQKIKIDVDLRATAETVGDKAEDTVDKVGDELEEGCSVRRVGTDRTRGLCSGLLPLIAALAFFRRRRR